MVTLPSSAPDNRYLDQRLTRERYRAIRKGSTYRIILVGVSCKLTPLVTLGRVLSVGRFASFYVESGMGDGGVSRGDSKRGAGGRVDRCFHSIVPAGVPLEKFTVREPVARPAMISTRR